MKTTKPISTISYNTPEFLENKLNELLTNGLISFFAYILHEPEEDETKRHFHVYMIPNREIDCTKFRSLFDELNPKDITKPYRCLLIEKSKFDDWYLYAIHDKSYLASKGQTRKFHYTEKKIHTSEPEYLHEKVMMIDNKNQRQQRFMELVLSGYTFIEIVLMGVVPQNQYFQYTAFYRDLMGMFSKDQGNNYDETYRHDRNKHENEGEENK